MKSENPDNRGQNVGRRRFQRESAAAKPTGMGLTERQAGVLEFVRSYTDEHGFPPSVRDIMRGVGLSSTSVVDYNLGALARKGHIKRTKDVSRGIGLVSSSVRQDRAGSVVSVPVVGRIAAGEPIEAILGHLETIALPIGLVSEEDYALRVKGKSMVEDLIDDGDLVIVKPCQTADNGEIVVALVLAEPTGSGQATLKRLYREKQMIRLQPANSEMDPIYVRPDDLKVQGRVVAVIRQVR